MRSRCSRGTGFYLRGAGTALLVAALVAGYVAVARTPELQQTLRPEAVRGLLDGLGPWGPPASSSAWGESNPRQGPPMLAVGSQLGDPTGVVGYRSDSYHVRVTEPIDFEPSGVLPRGDASTGWARQGPGPPTTS